MPVEGTNRTARLSVALQWDRGRWLGLFSLLVLLTLVLALGDTVDHALRYDRAAIADGGWWRLLTAHLVHMDAHHLILNELGLVLVWSLFADAYTVDEWLIIVFAGALCIGSGLWWLSPRVGWYVGASGVLHAAMAAGCVAHFRARADDRWILITGLCVKLAYEQWGGPGAALVVVDAHAYGALGGLAAAAIIWTLRACGRSL